MMPFLTDFVLPEIEPHPSVGSLDRPSLLITCKGEGGMSPSVNKPGATRDAGLLFACHYRLTTRCPGGV